MQPVETFLQEYFQERTEVSRAFGKLYAPLAERFLAPSYVSHDTEKSIADSESETIISVQVSAPTAEVITRGWMGADRRVRYRLLTLRDAWKIAAIEFECGICHGAGKFKDQETECRICKGNGWILMGKTKGTEGHI